MTDNPFRDLPADPETRIRKSEEVRVEGYPALHQHWEWQGIVGESLVFADEALDGLGGARLKKLVQSSRFVKGKGPVMLDHPGAGFTRLNFNYDA